MHVDVDVPPASWGRESPPADYASLDRLAIAEARLCKMLRSRMTAIDEGLAEARRVGARPSDPIVGLDGDAALFRRSPAAPAGSLAASDRHPGALESAALRRQVVAEPAARGSAEWTPVSQRPTAGSPRRRGPTSVDSLFIELLVAPSSCARSRSLDSRCAHPALHLPALARLCRLAAELIGAGPGGASGGGRACQGHRDTARSTAAPRREAHRRQREQIVDGVAALEVSCPLEAPSWASSGVIP